MEYLKIEMTQNNLKAHFWWKLAELANLKQLPEFFFFLFFIIIFIEFFRHETIETHARANARAFFMVIILSIGRVLHNDIPHKRCK